MATRENGPEKAFSSEDSTRIEAPKTTLRDVLRSRTFQVTSAVALGAAAMGFVANANSEVKSQVEEASEQAEIDALTSLDSIEQQAVLLGPGTEVRDSPAVIRESRFFGGLQPDNLSHTIQDNQAELALQPLSYEDQEGIKWLGYILPDNDGEMSESTTLDDIVWAKPELTNGQLDNGNRAYVLADGDARVGMSTTFLGGDEVQLNADTTQSFARAEQMVVTDYDSALDLLDAIDEFRP
jgi:hypothetical protein